MAEIYTTGETVKWWPAAKRFAWEHFVYVDWWEFGVAMWILVAAWLVRINIGV